jgi:hypothetical protein
MAKKQGRISMQTHIQSLYFSVTGGRRNDIERRLFALLPTVANS